MKDKETDYLASLFASASDEADAEEVAFPLVDVPADLGDRLHAIADLVPASVVPVKRNFFENWPTVTSIAATLLVSIVGVQFYQQQQTLKHLEQAQSDIAIALHYLGEANRITRAQMLNSLNETVSKEMSNVRANARTNATDKARAKAWLEPLEAEINTSNRSL